MNQLPFSSLTVKTYREILLKLEVKYFGTLRDVTNKAQETIEIFDEINLKELMKTLSDKYGTRFSDLLRLPYLRIFVNDRLFDEGDYEKKMRGGSTITFLLALHGGAL